MTWPFGALELENRLLALQNALLRSGGRRRSRPTKDERTVRDFGSRLFELLFSGEIRERYAVSRSEADRSGRGLRIKLRILAPELAALPWEYLYDARLANYLCLSLNTPVVRYLELPRPIPALPVKPPLRVLGMVAAPTDLVELDIDVEKQRVERAVADLTADGALELHWLPGSTWRDLHRAMRRGPWHIFHFIGHGEFDPQRGEGQIMLCDRNGRSQALSAANLATLLHDHNPLRLALLNSCDSATADHHDIFSSTAATLVRAGVPAALAMQYAITDAAAMEFATAFYDALADGLPVDAALAEARKAIHIGVNNSLEWGTPVLLTRAADGVIFAVEREGRTADVDGRPTTDHRRLSGADQPTLDEELPADDGGQVKEVGEPVSVVGDDDRGAVDGGSLSGTQYGRLVDALVNAFDRGGLQRLVRFRLDENLDAVAGGGNHSEVVFALIGWAESRGRLAELLAGALAENPGNRRLQAVAAELQPTHTAMRGNAPLYPQSRIDFDWVTIPAGEFIMGSDPNKDKAADDNETPQHRLHLPEYQIARTPVTNGQYKHFIDAVDHHAPSHWRGANVPTELAGHLVVNVSWNDAVAFCTWAGVELPSEALWEKAARGTDGRIWPWGNEASDAKRCNFDENEGGTTPVGSYPAGAYELNDMAGNVDEWTRSLWGEDWGKPDYGYPYDAADGREDLNASSLRVLRGGGWASSARWVRCAYRPWGNPYRGSDDRGFRVVRAPGF